jgi:phosphate uptake regulator
VNTIEKRKLWKTGKGTYITSFPVEWIVQLIEKYGDEIILSYENERIVILPSKKVENISGKIELKNSDLMSHFKIESEIIAAYLGNYDSLSVKLPEEKSYFSGKIFELMHKLEGASAERISSGEFLIKFLTPPTSITKLSNSNFSQYIELAKQNDELMSALPLSIEELEDKREIFTALECEVDKRTFHIKRLLNRALLYPWYLPAIELKDVRDLLQHSLLASSLERVCDLEEELFNEETKLSSKLHKMKNEIKLSEGSLKYDFHRYHRDVSNIVKFAYENKDSPNNLYKLMELKRNIDDDKDYGFDDFSRERREFLLEYIEKHPKYSTNLTRIEQKIWGTVGIATNIAETWTNLGLKEKEDGKITRLSSDSS